ncbi:MarR family transcriptional regulator [uncultured Lactobacillus sp.]|uniref:MarR family transcriptional regulator n=1 Tax=uncultured Lactobacillus sp. TaxID=153152 RepID=UPI002633A346|nr:MarR family transcriptional regulator [uncultured Lactobacillus sp.]
MNNKYDQISEYIASFTQIYSGFAKKYGLSYNELHCFYYLVQHERATMSEISKLWSIPKQTLNSFRNKYVKKGYISVIADSEDKRKKFITLTQEGKDFTLPIIEKLTQAEKAASKGLSDQEYASYLAVFDQIIENLIANLD